MIRPDLPREGRCKQRPYVGLLVLLMLSACYSVPQLGATWDAGPDSTLDAPDGTDTAHDGTPPADARDGRDAPDADVAEGLDALDAPDAPDAPDLDGTDAADADVADGTDGTDPGDAEEAADTATTPDPGEVTDDTVDTAGADADGRDATEADSTDPCTPGAAAFGCPCTAPDDCADGWCLPHLGDLRCSRTCVPECPFDYACDQLTLDREPVYVCVSEGPALCLPCATNADCQALGGSPDDACVATGAASGSFCGATCTNDPDCPDGYACTDTVSVDGGNVRQCTPSQGECPCSQAAIDQSLSTPCALTNEAGTCPGHRTCTAEGLTACDAPTPAPEACNGADDDCDGATDEDASLARRSLGEGGLVRRSLGEGGCDDQNPCTADACVAGGCTHDAAAHDAGTCDDGDPCTDGTVCQGGSCQGGFVKSCDDDDACTTDGCDALTGDCTHEPVEPTSTPEACNGADDDCDGAVDEGFTYGGAPIGASCDGRGLCAVGKVECMDAATATCSSNPDGTASQAVPETCDGADDDCDGATDDADEDLCLPGEECTGGTCQCVPDCDGKACGDDGCGGSCGSCGTGRACDKDHCVTQGFVYVPAGSFWMGSPAGEPCPDGYAWGGCPAAVNTAQELGRSDGESLHAVTLTIAFEVQAREVTQGEWGAVFPGYDPSHFSQCGAACPVESVSWYDAAAYANALSLREGLAPCYALDLVACSNESSASSPSECMNPTSGGIWSALVTLTSPGNPYACTGYRLPTEAEWEYAYRAGGHEAFYESEGNSGTITAVDTSPLDPNLAQIAWYGGNSKATYAGVHDCSGWYTGASTCGPHEGGAMEPNALGTYDQAGNVWEWCWDAYDAYPSSTATNPAKDPLADKGSLRVFRGGAWDNNAFDGRASQRAGSSRDTRRWDLGFRLVRSVGPFADTDADGDPDVSDCAPADSGRAHGLSDGCDGADNNCDGLTDEGFPDTDGDGLADCVDPDVDNDGDPDVSDCFPYDATIHHGASETCNGADDDCDGGTDEDGAGCAAGQECSKAHCVTAGFAWVPAGAFWMGSPAGQTCPEGYSGGGCNGSSTSLSEPGRQADEALHYVSLTRAVEVQVGAVTQGEWKARFGGWNPSAATACGDACPVEGVSWYDALAYANALSKAAGLPECYELGEASCADGSGAAGYEICLNATHGGVGSASVSLLGTSTPYGCLGYRLPTEAEWEHAYRAGSLTPFHPSPGNDGSLTATTCATDPNLAQIGWYCGTTNAVHPGKALEPNAWGLYDLAGNVAAWCWDAYAAYPSGNIYSPNTDPPGLAGAEPVVRGGTWNGYASTCRAAYRGTVPPDARANNLGLRLVRTRATAGDDDADGDPNTTDCAPTDPAIHHDASETCNGRDDDCDAQTDEGSTLCSLTGTYVCSAGACVTAPQVWVDGETGLVWQRTVVDQLTHPAALTYCQSNAAGLPGNGWHLPTIGELRSLVRDCDASATGGSCEVTDSCAAISCWDDTECAPCLNAGGPSGGCYWEPDLQGDCWDAYFWSSTLAGGLANEAWMLLFRAGALTHYAIDAGATMHVRCVRSGP
jgi:formylglycine-generating enzyme required for sulfatase activity